RPICCRGATRSSSSTSTSGSTSRPTTAPTRTSQPPGSDVNSARASPWGLPGRGRAGAGDVQGDAAGAQRGQLVLGGFGVDDDQVEGGQRGELVQPVLGELAVVDQQDATVGGVHQRPLHRHRLL